MVKGGGDSGSFRRQMSGNWGKAVSAFAVHKGKMGKAAAAKEISDLQDPTVQKKAGRPSAGSLSSSGSSSASAVSKDSREGGRKKAAKRRRQHLDASLPSLQDQSPLDSQTAALTMLEKLRYDSLAASESILAWLLSPVSLPDFFRKTWEQQPLHVRRNSSEVYEGVFSTTELDRILRENELDYSQSLDITQYVGGRRETLNPSGKVYAPLVWDFYNQGCSVRMRDPAAHSQSLWRLCSLLQEAFSSFVGANVYLTPGGTQGFAPHWDDIDAFILQLEGSKHWKVYAPREEEEVLPRFSSPNFSEDDLPKPPELDVWLKPGDLLYLPRGWIHQGSCGTEHSLHVTLSVCQKDTWADLLEKVLPSALDLVTQEDRRFRQSLPRDYLSTMGVANQPDEESHVPKSRKDFLKAYKERLGVLMEKLEELGDAAADQMGKEFLHGALPPVLTENERGCSVVGNGERWDQQRNQVAGVAELEPDTCVKLVRRQILRLCEEGEAADNDAVRVYHAAANTRNFKERDEVYFDVSAELAPGLDFLLQTYPDYAPIEAMGAAGLEIPQALKLAEELYARSLLITEEPLEPTYE